MNKEQLREEWSKFVDTLPSRVGETPREVIADWWLKKMATQKKEIVEMIKKERLPAENVKHPPECVECKEVAAYNAALSEIINKLKEI